MAYQVAQAYDEDKNLVPLYILTDGEVPEVSPGFSAIAANATVTITQTSTNPTGGTLDLGDMELIKNTWKIENLSQFTIKVSMSMLDNVGAQSSTGSITIDSMSYSNLSWTPFGSGWGGNITILIARIYS